jgi:hypothetical protein
MANVYNKPGATLIYLTIINNTRANLQATMGPCQIGLETDTGLLAFVDHNGNYTTYSIEDALVHDHGAGTTGALVKFLDGMAGTIEDANIFEIAADGVQLCSTKPVAAYPQRIGLGAVLDAGTWKSGVGTASNAVFVLDYSLSDSLIIRSANAIPTNPGETLTLVDALKAFGGSSAGLIALPVGVAVGKSTAPFAKIDISATSGDSIWQYLIATGLAHGVTTVASTDAFMRVKSYGSGTDLTKGGAQILGLSADATYPAMEIAGVAYTSPTEAAVVLKGVKKNGTGTEAVANTEPVLNVKNSTTTIVSVKGNGDTIVSGIVKGKAMAASIHCHDASAAQSIANGTSYTKLTCFTDNGMSQNMTADAANDRITTIAAGIYDIHFNVSVYASVSNLNWKIAVFIDGVEIDSIHSENKLATSGDRQSFCACDTVQVAAAKDIELRVRHDHGTNASITVTYANLRAIYIGESV